MHRLFVAVRPPEAIRALLLGAMGGISGARWQTDDQLHLTLRFIGEVDRHAAGDIVAALGGIRHPSLEIAISGLGTFERGKATIESRAGKGHAGSPRRGGFRPCNPSPTKRPRECSRPK